MHKDSTYMQKDSTGDAVGVVVDDSAVIHAAGCTVVFLELDTWVTKKIHACFCLARWPKKQPDQGQDVRADLGMPQVRLFMLLQIKLPPLVILVVRLG